jgi:hypothetical protein
LRTIHAILLVIPPAGPSGKRLESREIPTSPRCPGDGSRGVGKTDARPDRSATRPEFLSPSRPRIKGRTPATVSDERHVPRDATRRSLQPSSGKSRLCRPY